MAYIEPNSDVILLSRVPLDPSYENTLYFNSLTEQHTYFRTANDFGRLAFSKYSYARKSRNTIKVEINTSSESLINYTAFNYMMFKNTSFENKWFYAFITNSEYVNNNTVIYTYEIDVLQTWFFDYDFNDCLIEREHTETDEIGDNLLEENLETGEYIVNPNQNVPTDYPITPIVCLAVTMVIDSSSIDPSTPDKASFLAATGEIVERMGSKSAYYNGCAFLFYGIGDSDPTIAAAELTRLNYDLSLYTNNNKINAIVSAFMAPYEIFNPQRVNLFADIHESVRTRLNSTLDYYVDGYVPHNKKLLTYPYSFLQVSNYQGEAFDFRYEYFSDPLDIIFLRNGNIGTTPAIAIYPVSYKGLSPNFEAIVTNQCYPQCSFNYDTYKAWLAQNQGALAATGAIVAGGLLVGGLSAINGTHLNGIQYPAVDTGVSGKTGLAAVGGALATAITTIGKIHDHSTLPTSQHGNGNGNLMYELGMGGFAIYHKSIRYEFAKIIDDFFTMYGYKTCRVGKPRINVRPCYNYVKTVGCSLRPKSLVDMVETAEVPAEHARMIESIYNNGVRFWKRYVDQNTPVVFGSYDWTVNNNAPVSNNNQGGE